MMDEDKDALAEAVAELIRTNDKVRVAVWRTVCQCPNLVVQH